MKTVQSSDVTSSTAEWKCLSDRRGSSNKTERAYCERKSTVYIHKAHWIQSIYINVHEILNPTSTFWLPHFLWIKPSVWHTLHSVTEEPGQHSEREDYWQSLTWFIFLLLTVQPTHAGITHALEVNLTCQTCASIVGHCWQMSGVFSCPEPVY